MQKGVLRISQNPQENTCVRVSFLSKKKHYQRCFPVNAAKFLRIPFLQNTSGRLFLGIVRINVFLETVLALKSSAVNKSNKKRYALKESR